MIRTLRIDISLRNILFLLLTLTLLATPKLSFALNLEERNYFASIKAGKANVRTGPGKNYHVKFTYNIRYMPIKVIGKYDNWNEIEDFEGERGWINRNLVSRKRTIIVRTAKSFVNMHSAATKKSRILLKLQDNVIAKLIGCKTNWCKVEIRGKKGWLKSDSVWPNKKLQNK